MFNNKGIGALTFLALFYMSILFFLLANLTITSFVCHGFHNVLLTLSTWLALTSQDVISRSKLLSKFQRTCFLRVSNSPSGAFSLYVSGGQARRDLDLWLVLSPEIITFSFLKYSSNRSSYAFICLSFAPIVSCSLMTKCNICEILYLE